MLLGTPPPAMPERPEYPREEVARRGDAIYDERVRPAIDEDAERGKYVLIDVHSGDFEIGDDEMAAGDRLAERRPEARVWLTRVGSRYGYFFGARPRKPEASS